MFTGNNFEFDIYSIEDIPVERRKEIIGKVAQEIVDRNMTTPAIFLLEMGKPLSFLGSQAMIAVNPFVQAFFPSRVYRELSVILEKREYVEMLITEIERRNNEVKTRN